MMPAAEENRVRKVRVLIEFGESKVDMTRQVEPVDGPLLEIADLLYATLENTVYGGEDSPYELTAYILLFAYTCALPETLPPEFAGFHHIISKAVFDYSERRERIAREAKP